MICNISVKMFVTFVLWALLVSTVAANLTERGDFRFFTNLNGELINDITNTLSLGEYGPIPLYDQNFLEQISHFNRERIHRRRMATNGGGAFGYFECTNSKLKKLTRASLFSRAGKITKITQRFSAASPAIKDVEPQRIFHLSATKFYTEEGNFDLNQITPIGTSIRDGNGFSDTVRVTIPANNILSQEPTLDLAGQNPQFLHVTLFNHMDNSLPDGWRQMNAYSPTTHTLINSKGEIHYARFSMIPLTTFKYLNERDAAWIRGHYPDYFSRDLVLAIKRGDYPKWSFRAQIMTPEQFKEMEYNPLDVTKVWDEKRFPPIILGKIVLNRNYDNFFAQNELAAFSPSNLVPGIDISLDRNFQARLYAYRDAQNYRLGVNHRQLPINRPKAVVNTPTIRDGFYADPSYAGSDPSYFPNSYGKTKFFGRTEAVIKLPQVKIKRWDTSDDDNYSHVNMTWSRLDEGEKHRTAERLGERLAPVSEPVQTRFLGQVRRASLDFYNKLVVAVRTSKEHLVNGPSCTCNKKLLRRFNLDYIRKK